MSGDAIDRLVAEASRGDYSSMVRLARALYQAGLGRREVLRRCYGVDFPEELFVIYEAWPTSPRLLVSYTNQPWELLVTPDQGDPAAKPDLLDGVERRIFARDPDLVPLGLLLADGGRWLGMVVCYRLSELAAGRSTVFGILEEFGPADGAVRCGDSLLTVLHDHHVDAHRRLQERYLLPSNFGAGAVDLEEVAAVGSLVERIEELQTRVATGAP